MKPIKTVMRKFCKKLKKLCRKKIMSKKNGKVDIPINYPPRFFSRYGYGQPKASSILDIFLHRTSDQKEYIEEIKKYSRELSIIPIRLNENDPGARWDQTWFPPLDGMSLYTMIASNKPQIYLELGSGNSTKFAYRAIKDNDLKTKIISIDPEPRAEVDAICDQVIRKRVEDVIELDEIVSKLQPNDVVFFDGSHRCLQNSDVTSFFIDWLPKMPQDIKVGIHDIFWPNDYPPHWVERYYNEQYILGAYMLGQGRRFPLIFSCAYMGSEFPENLQECLNKNLVSDLRNLGKTISGGSLWFSKCTL